MDAGLGPPSLDAVVPDCQGDDRVVAGEEDGRRIPGYNRECVEGSRWPVGLPARDRSRNDEE